MMTSPSRLTLAAHPAEGWEYLRGQRFDIVIIDFELGTMDAGDFTRRLRRDKQNINRKVPVLTTTARPNRHLVGKARDCGISSIVAKPMQTSELFRRVHALVTEPRPFVETDNYAGPVRLTRLPDGRTEECVPDGLGDTRGTESSEPADPFHSALEALDQQLAGTRPAENVE